MYARFFGLNESPFELTSNLRYLFLTPKHRAVLSTLQYGISSRKGTTLLVGEAGTGKTTLIRAALAAQRDESASCIYLSNPTLNRGSSSSFSREGSHWDRWRSSPRPSFWPSSSVPCAGRSTRAA